MDENKPNNPEAQGQNVEQPKQESDNKLTPQTENAGANVEKKLDMILEILGTLLKGEVKEPEHKAEKAELESDKKKIGDIKYDN